MTGLPPGVQALSEALTESREETREAWLGRAAEAMAPWLEGEEIPPMRISVGFPGGTSNRNKTIGQCWATSQSEDGISQIFISPIRGAAETVDVLGTLLHEMIHAVDDCESGHKGNFRRIAKRVGFCGKLTSSDNRTDELTERIEALAKDIGAFPHATLSAGGRAADQPKKQGTRMLKVVCPDDGYTLRTTQKWIDVGLPTCPCGTEMEVPA